MGEVEEQYEVSYSAAAIFTGPASGDNHDFDRDGLQNEEVFNGIYVPPKVLDQDAAIY